MSGITHREILLGVLAIGGFAAFAFARDKLRSGYLLFIYTLGLGYRTLPITSALRIHPAELLLWALLAWLKLDRNGEPAPRTRAGLPQWLWFFMPFWLVGWIPSAHNRYAWDVQFSEFRNFPLFIPLFLVTPVVLSKQEFWRPVIAAFYGVGSVIAVLGATEYVFPGIRDLLPGFVGDPSAVLSADGFARARFSCWGGPHATFICVLAMPFAAPLWSWRASRSAGALVLGGLAFQIVAVYIGGYRSMWLLTVVELLLFLALERKFFLAATVCLAAFVGTQAMPSKTRDRVDTLLLILQGRPIDSSGIKRQDRALVSLADALEHPAGNGWASAGWVHSDFIQVAANLGVAAGLIFLGAYAATAWRLWITVSSRRTAGNDDPLSMPLFLSFVSAGGMLAVEGIEVLPQTSLPVWLIWALAHAWLRQLSFVPRVDPCLVQPSPFSSRRTTAPTSYARR